MNTLAFLEAVLSSDDAALFAEQNSEIVEFAVAEIDSLVEEQSAYICCNLSKFVSSNLTTTYNNMHSSVSDIISESSSMFGAIIASDLSEYDKRELIEATAHAISFDDSFILQELSVGAVGRGAGNFAAASAASAVGGAVGRKVGSGVGKFASLFSKERRVWKQLIKQESAIRKQLQNHPNPSLKSKLANVVKAKERAHQRFMQVKDKMAKRGDIVGGITGSIGAGFATPKVFKK